MSADKARTGARLRAERRARSWGVSEMARRLRQAAKDLHVDEPDHNNVAAYIGKRWESGRFEVSERYRLLYAHAFGIPEGELFSGDAYPAPMTPVEPFLLYGEDSTKRRSFVLQFLAGLGLSGQARALIYPASSWRIGREHVDFVQSTITELERREAAVGGDSVCDGAAVLLDTVHGWLEAGSYPEETGNALTEAAGLLGAWVGWAAYDADRQHMARHYYAETLLFARTHDDLQLEARVLAYMSLQARRRKRPREAVQLAQTALRVSAGWTTARMGALLHLRTAQGYAETHDHAAYRRHVARAKNLYDEGPHEDDPAYLSALTPAEMTGIEAMSHMAWGDHQRAAGLFLAAADDDSGDVYRRNSTYYAVRFADALLRAGDETGAFDAARAAVPRVAQINSSRTRKHLEALRQSAATANTAAAREFADSYDDTLIAG